MSADGRLQRATFATYADARGWRLKRLRELYPVADTQTPGRLDTAYALLRRCISELDRAQRGLDREAVATARVAIDELYRAEDELVSLL